MPKYISRLPRVRVLHCRRDWGPATKFIPVIQEELAAGTGGTLIMVVDDDRVYPHDALETYLFLKQAIARSGALFSRRRNTANSRLA
jgi:hypothetical protein